MGRAPWFKCYPTDFLADLNELDARERGVFTTIYMMIIDTGGPLKFDEMRLARRCGETVRSFKRIVDALLECERLTLKDGKLSIEHAEGAVRKREVEMEGRRRGADATNSRRYGKGEVHQGEGVRSPTRTGRATRARAKDSEAEAGAESRSKEPDDTRSAQIGQDGASQHVWDEFIGDQQKE